MQMIRLLLFIWVFGFWLSASCWASSFPGKYDRDFKATVSRYLPGVPWRLLKAQCWQESRLRVNAVSPVGAMGLCQFMPGTWKDVSRRLVFGANTSVFNPSLSIEAAGYYMGSLRRQWSAPRPDRDRHELALASYNAGLGHLLTAQRQCRGVNLYHDIIRCLPSVTGHHSEETINYVILIYKYWRRMELGG